MNLITVQLYKPISKNVDSQLTGWNWSEGKILHSSLRIWDGSDNILGFTRCNPYIVIHYHNMCTYYVSMLLF